MNPVRITLPWPPKELSSNSRAHWRAKATKVKACREHAALETRCAWIGHLPNAVLEFEFHPPDRRKRDAHNMPAMMKAYIDGIADGMRCDDRHFKVIFPSQFGEVRKGGQVVVTITEQSNE